MSYRTDKTSYGLSRGASFIETKEQLKKFVKKYNLHQDWHDLEEQEISATVLGEYLGNSGSGDEYLVILKHHRMPVARVNLSTLLYLASE